MNPIKLREKLKTIRVHERKPIKKAHFIAFRTGRSQIGPSLVPVTVLNQIWPVFVSSEVFIGPEDIACVSPCLNSANDVSIRFNENGVKRINGLKRLDDDYTLVLYINNHPVQNVALTQQITKASEVRIPIGSSAERDDFLKYYRALK